MDAIRAAEDTLMIPNDVLVDRVDPQLFNQKKMEWAANAYNPYGDIVSIAGGDDSSAVQAR